SKHLSVHSLDDIAALINITASLQHLSSSDSAEQAQSWLYELPGIYRRRLTQANLIISEAQQKSQTSSVKTEQPPHFVSWVAYGTNKGSDTSVTSSTRMTIPTEKAPEATQAPVSLEPNKTLFTPAA